MIHSNDINRFRCFENTAIKGFGDVNLIGGLNNAGKTALLEAILLSNYPTGRSIEFLREIRNERFELDWKINPWRFLFYNQNDKTDIQIISKDTDEKIISRISVSSSQNINDAVDKNNYLASTNLEKILRETSMLYLLNIMGSNNNEEFGYLPLFRSQGTRFRFPLDFIGKKPKNYDANIDGIFFHPLLKKEDTALASMYSVARNQNNIQHFNDVLSKIDKNIVGSEIDAPDGKSVINLILKNGQRLPVRMFGDAIRKAVEIILALFNMTNTVLFIDEIENGLHYTKYCDFWNAIFQISITQKVQIFATTHSKEMIAAFAQSSNLHPNRSGTYLQLYRSTMTEQIVASPYQIDELSYAVSKNIPLRGE